jgi:uroporphyrinogen-III synthase
MSKSVMIRIDEQGRDMATKAAAILQKKRGKVVTIGEATAEALQAYLKELEENNDGK